MQGVCKYHRSVFCVSTSGPQTLSAPCGNSPVAHCQIHTGAQLALDMAICTPQLHARAHTHTHRSACLWMTLLQGESVKEIDQSVCIGYFTRHRSAATTQKKRRPGSAGGGLISGEGWSNMSAGKQTEKQTDRQRKYMTQQEIIHLQIQLK